MAKYIKKQTVIEAFQFLNNDRDYQILNWINSKQKEKKLLGAYLLNGKINIPTDNDLIVCKEVRFEEWIILSETGDIYTCSDDLFQLMYEPMGD